MFETYLKQTLLKQHSEREHSHVYTFEVSLCAAWQMFHYPRNFSQTTLRMCESTSPQMPSTRARSLTRGGIQGPRRTPRAMKTTRSATRERPRGKQLVAPVGQQTRIRWEGQKRRSTLLWSSKKKKQQKKQDKNKEGSSTSQ